MIETFDSPLGNGIELSCRAPGAAGAPLLVFLHGFPEAAFVWDALLEHFADRFRCVAPNLRGFERSSAPAEVEAYRAKHLVADIAALIDAARRPRSRRSSPTTGVARVAWSLAAQRPELLERLVIVNSPHPATFLRELQHRSGAAGGERLHALPLPARRRGAAARERLRPAVAASSPAWAPTDAGRAGRRLADRRGARALPRRLARGLRRRLQLLPRLAAAAAPAPDDAVMTIVLRAGDA